MGLRYLDMEAFRTTPRASEPFEYLVVPGFVRADACARINADYPKISERGSFPVAQLAFGPAFQEFLDELESDEFRTAFEEKFAIDLTGRPTTITVLIYMNPSWEESGGRLRLLRSGDDLDDVITEVPPNEGTLLAFKRADNSWHGHKPFSGPRRAIQFNWVTSEGNRRIAMLRHHLSAPFKRVLGALRPGHTGDRAAARH